MKRTTEDEMVGWHHRLNARDLEQSLGDGEGQGSLACCSPKSHKELDMTWRLNNKTCFCLSSPVVACSSQGSHNVAVVAKEVKLGSPHERPSERLRLNVAK